MVTMSWPHLGWYSATIWPFASLIVVVLLPSFHRGVDVSKRTRPVASSTTAELRGFLEPKVTFMPDVSIEGVGVGGYWRLRMVRFKYLCQCDTAAQGGVTMRRLGQRRDDAANALRCQWSHSGLRRRGICSA